VSWLEHPLELGRGIVVNDDDDVPEQFRDYPTLALTQTLVDDADALEQWITELHAAWAERRPVVVTWSLDHQKFFPAAQTNNAKVFSIEPDFLFPGERLNMLLFANNYDLRGCDLRGGEPKWWLTKRALDLPGCEAGGPADVILGDGTPAWIDGGPSGAIAPVDHAVISGEELEFGRLTRIDQPVLSPDDALADDQRAATLHMAGAARVIAPAGSGKTRTMSARLRHLLDDRGVAAESVIAVAYNKRAADELRERAGAPKQTVRTVHSLGWAILRDAYPNLSLLGEADQRRLLDELVHVQHRANTDPIAPYLEALDQVRLGLQSPSWVEGEGDDLEDFAEAFGPYRERLYAAGSVDHAEQIYGAIEVLLRNAALRRTWQRRCRHLLIDEFQDLTPAYVLLLRLLASPRLQVYGVGDDDQVIYGYSGADPRFLTEFDQWFPGATHYALETNYRCPAPVVAAATNLLSWNRVRVDKSIKPGPQARQDPEAFRVMPGISGEMALDAADRIEEWIAAGTDPKDIAVLSRVNASLIPVKAVLVERDIPTHDQLGMKSVQRSMVRALFAWLRMAQDPSEMSATDVREAIRRPGRGLNGVANNTRLPSQLSLEELRDASMQMKARHEAKWLEFCDDIEKVVRASRSGDARKAIGAVLDTAGLISSAQAFDRSGNSTSKPSHEDDLAAIQRAATLHTDLATFEAWLSRAMERPSSTDGVTISSIHRVKGMEWPKVIVFGADAGAIPHRLSDDREEERRIFHVAITRCSDEVVVLADQDRPSPFLNQLTTVAPPPGAAPKRPDRGQVRSRFKQSGKQTSDAVVGDLVSVGGGYQGRIVSRNDDEVLIATESGPKMYFKPDDIVKILESSAGSGNTGETELGPEDEALFEALRAWRMDRATDAGVPAYVVAGDATMRLIAAARPTTDTELLAIKGIGAAKLENYGDDIIDIVSQFEN